MKSWAAAGLTLALVAGCASGAPATRTSSDHDGPLASITYINPLPRDPFWDVFGACLRREAAKHRIRIVEKGPAGGNVNIQAMENLLAHAVSARAQAVATWPGAPAAFDPMFARIRARGGLVAALGDGSAENDIVAGNLLKPRLLALVRAVAGRAGEHRVGVVLQFPPGGDGGLAEAVENEFARHPNLTLVSLRYNGGQFTADVQLVKSMLTVHPDIDTLVNYSGFPGMFTAVRESGRARSIRVYAPANFREAMVEYIHAGLVGGVLLEDRCAVGRFIVDGFVAARDGKPHARTFDGNPTVVSPRDFLTPRPGWV